MVRLVFSTYEMAFDLLTKSLVVNIYIVEFATISLVTLYTYVMNC